MEIEELLKDEVLTVIEVAKIMKLSRDTIMNYIHRDVNPLPVVKMHTGQRFTYRIIKKQFIEWLETQEDPRQDV